MALQMSMSIVKVCWGGCRRKLDWIQVDGSKQKQESQTKIDQDAPLKVLEKERQKGDQETMCGATLLATRGAGAGGYATQRRKSDSELGLDYKLKRIFRIKLNEDIQPVRETKWYF